MILTPPHPPQNNLRTAQKTADVTWPQQYGYGMQQQTQQYGMAQNNMMNAQAQGYGMNNVNVNQQAYQQQIMMQQQHAAAQQ